MARTTMADLISLMRDLVGDPAGSEQLLSDNQVERALDAHRWDRRYEPLNPLTTVSGSTSTYLDWYSDEQYWESDEALYDISYGALTPSSSEPMLGKWSFLTTQATVLISGKTYDPYGAAADLLEMLAAKYAGEYDVNADGASLARSQRPKALLALAAQYRKQQKTMICRTVRNDLG